tara:strand:- start:34 stop:288 length:255 start_codon:yes stop_codon:yes gene_type:complete
VIIMFSRKVISYDGEDIVEEVLVDVNWNKVRTHRDAALIATDWRAVKDRTMSQAWKDYRQALRDLPQDHASANDAADNWPQPPE